VRGGSGLRSSWANDVPIPDRATMTKDRASFRFIGKAPGVLGSLNDPPGGHLCGGTEERDNPTDHRALSGAPLSDAGRVPLAQILETPGDELGCENSVRV
jgi:hypothetical protein